MPDNAERRPGETEAAPTTDLQRRYDQGNAAKAVRP